MVGKYGIGASRRNPCELRADSYSKTPTANMITGLPRTETSAAVFLQQLDGYPELSVCDRLAQIPRGCDVTFVQSISHDDACGVPA